MDTMESTKPTKPAKPTKPTKPDTHNSEREYEIVIQSKDIPMRELKERLRGIGGTKVQDESVFVHIAYTHPYKRNKRHFIRLRNEGSKVTLTYKIHDHKFPIEHEIVVNDFNEAHTMLTLLGCKYKYECHKLREIWSLESFEGCKEIVFDTYPGVETYAEIECDSVGDIQTVLRKVGLDPDVSRYKRLFVNTYYQDIYGIHNTSPTGGKRLTFVTAYTLLQHATKNKDLLQRRLDEAQERHKEQILQVESIQSK